MGSLHWVDPTTSRTKPNNWAVTLVVLTAASMTRWAWVVEQLVLEMALRGEVISGAGVGFELVVLKGAGSTQYPSRRPASDTHAVRHEAEVVDPGLINMKQNLG